jgi:protein involved in polysaccharide export with SLBB domain
MTAMPRFAFLFAALFATATALAQLTTPPAQQPAGQPAAPQNQPPAPALLPGTIFQPGQPAISPGTRATPPAPTPSPPAPASALPAGAVPFDYSVNLKSDLFGAQLFTGAFVQSPAAIFNPNHVIAVGDQLQVRLWGGFEFDALLAVDPQGNIFVPHVGPVRVAGLANRDLPKALEESLRKAFRANVFSYVSLASAQPVRVFVTGFVHRPGMYFGSSTDSVLRFLDQAGGIDPERGSFLDVQVRRGRDLRATINLYDFLLSGTIPSVQLGDGDVVVVNPRKSTFKVSGLAENPKRFEFVGTSIRLSELIALAKPSARATNVRVTRNTGMVRNTEYYALAEAGVVPLTNGDDIEFTADTRPGTITVRVEGEHIGRQEYVLPYGSRFGELIKQVPFTERSDTGNVQLFRLTIKERQRLQLQTALKSLEATVLTARSGTVEEAQLRKTESELVMQWIERAQKLEPRGQVLIARSPERDDLLLENGDIVRIPVKDNLVLVSGEVLFPNAVAYDAKRGIEDYIRQAGGYTQGADTSRIIIAHRDGSFDEGQSAGAIRPGDEILVLPRVDTKLRQFWKDVAQIIFQIAVVVGVVAGL